MTGKHYSRAMHFHKILLEALERLLFSKSEKEFTHQEKTPGIKKEVVSFSSFSQL
jgi:hypothetical protein